MARPRKPRSSEAYHRQILELGRLRGAVVLDDTLPPDEMRGVISDIDRLTARLIKLRDAKQAA